MWPKQIGKKQLSNYSKKDSCSSRALFVITSPRLGATWFGWIAVALIPVCFSLSWHSSPNMHRFLHVALRCVVGDWLQWPYVHAPYQHWNYSQGETFCCWIWIQNALWHYCGLHWGQIAHSHMLLNHDAIVIQVRCMILGTFLSRVNVPKRLSISPEAYLSVKIWATFWNLVPSLNLVDFWTGSANNAGSLHQKPIPSWFLNSNLDIVCFGVRINPSDKSIRPVLQNPNKCKH